MADLRKRVKKVKDVTEPITDKISPLQNKELEVVIAEAVVIKQKENKPVVTVALTNAIVLKTVCIGALILLTALGILLYIVSSSAFLIAIRMGNVDVIKFFLVSGVNANIAVNVSLQIV